MSSSTLEVRLLGGFAIKAGKKSLNLPSRAAQSLFAYLILNSGTSYRREKLAGMLWPDSTEESARDYLRHALWRIRKTLQEGGSLSLLQADDLSMGFDAAGEVWFDGREVQNAGLANSPDDMMKALSAYGGELLPGFYDEWVVLEREHLQAAYEQAAGRLLHELQIAGRWNDVLTWAEKWIAFGQRPEAAYRALMSAHAANGDMSRVAATYERCVKTLKDFGVDPSEQTRLLYEELKTGKARPRTPPAAAPAAQSTSINTIPVPLTSFIGRGLELKKTAELLASTRLLTLTGPGGVGKTRLAIETARAVQKRFPDGVLWVGLAAISDQGLIPLEIAHALQLRESPDEALITTLTRHLQAKKLLLVLDNCEHLIQACARIAEIMLAECPHVRVLATGIEGLGLFNETLLQVPSLPLPDARALPPLKELRTFESVRLFEERAAHANAGFSLSEQNAAHVVQICTRLDGIPLAIELAAARMKVLSVQEIASRLDDRFSLLTAGSRTAIPRHQTLRATIDWSHDLLTDPERTLFRRLAVFAGGFTLEAAEAVCAEEPAVGGLLDLLGRLVDKSLVSVDSSAESRETRYRLLETIRQYALEKLMASAEAATIRDRHLDYYLHMAEDSETSGFGTGGAGGGWWPKLDADLDNIRAGIEWAIASGKADRGLRILGASVYFWFARGHQITEWNDSVQRALSRPEGRQRTQARAKALNGMGFWYWADLAPIDRRADLEEALSIGRELGDDWNIATTLRTLGLLENIQGNYPAARALLEESLEIWKRLGPEAGGALAISLTFLGDLALIQNKDEEARPFYEESVRILEERQDSNWQAYSVRRLGHLAWRAGDHQKAFELVSQSLQLNQEVFDPRGVLACLAAFAAVATWRGPYGQAAVLAAASEAQLAAYGIRLLYVDRLEFERTLVKLREGAPARKLKRLWDRGAAMSLDEALAFANRPTG